jgi:hypothetical protein
VIAPPVAEHQPEAEHYPAEEQQRAEQRLENESGRHRQQAPQQSRRGRPQLVVSHRE